MHRGMEECSVSYLGHSDLDLVSRIGIKSGVYPIFFELGSPNLVCGCNIFGH